MSRLPRPLSADGRSFDALNRHDRTADPAADHIGLPGALPEGEGLLGARVDYDAHSPVRLSGPEAHSLADHRRRFGPRPSAAGTAADTLLDTLDRIRLAGRGGAHFPAAVKWRAALSAGGGGTVVANAAEGEPASAKDAALLQHRTHLVLDGLACAAEAIGADRAVVWLHAGAHSTHRALTRALAERRSAGLRDPHVELVTGPDAYLSGESSAIIRALSGGPTLPTFRRVPAARSGIGGRPALVHNVETLARVALAARTGADDHRDSTLVTVVSDGRRTVLELDPATTVAQALAVAAVPAGAAGRTVGAGLPPEQRHAPLRAVHDPVSGTAGEPQAILLGGYGGGWLPWDQAADLRLEHRALREAGTGLGAGILAVLPAGVCGLQQTALIADYLAGSGARQCGPCLFGLRDVADLMLDLAAGRAGRSDVRRLERFAGEIEGRGGCHHPDGVVRLVRTALDTFADHVDEHLRQGRCLLPEARLPFPVPPGPQA
ncbi:MAG TPA: NADH-ubiquinone oxidoreductase-F iron-sulfur binding region domain-containing protein [Kineosporiaceae bacterium]|nr:NADH-ubiquinone oxidoreductase-F iron-sulfur binding region domain-containing protein [Kineosporiaceae bacterium]